MTSAEGLRKYRADNDYIPKCIEAYFMKNLILTLALFSVTACSGFQAANSGPVIFPNQEQMDSISLTFKSNKDLTDDCFQERLLAKPGLTGAMALTFLIDDEGAPLEMNINKSVSGLADQELALCIFDAMEFFNFPRAPRGELLRVDYELKF